MCTLKTYNPFDSKFLHRLMHLPYKHVTLSLVTSNVFVINKCLQFFFEVVHKLDLYFLELSRGVNGKDTSKPTTFYQVNQRFEVYTIKFFAIVFFLLLLVLIYGKTIRF